MAMTHPPLDGADFSLVHFNLRMRGQTLLTPQLLLGMRSGLKRAARRLDPTGDGPHGAMIDPVLADDPWAARPLQKPAPAFAFSPPGLSSREFTAQEIVALSFCFWGSGVQKLPLFAETFRELGRQGLERGLAGFELETVGAEDATGSSSIIWKEGEDLAGMAPPIIPMEWWLDGFSIPGERLTVHFHTPARLISHDRPLFQAGFGDIFPFMLRRVTSMLQHYCNFRQVIDGRSLVARAAGVRTVAQSLSWQDWKSIGSGDGPGAVGGILGELVVEGAEVPELLWVAALGSLLNIGKGAAFGAGNYSLH
jgi:hypothetical protein